MIKNFLILPDQLFPEIKKLDIDNIILYEEKKYFCEYNYNKKKLLLHRAGLKNFQQELKSEFTEAKIDYFEFKTELAEIIKNFSTLRLYDPINKDLKSKIEKIAVRHGIELEFLENPNFLTTSRENEEYFAENKFFQHKYYQMQRKRLNILLDEEKKPLGGKWSFDSKNRKRFPKEISIPEPPKFNNSYLAEAKSYVEKNFTDNPGNLENFIYPVNRGEAKELLADFIANKLDKFGDYQDGFEKNIYFGFHSLLSSSLNTGLLNPAEVVKEVLDYYKKNELPLSSVEGFIRQIIGWREYVRALYELEYENMLKSNFFNHQRKFPSRFYRAKTDIAVVDDLIEKASDYAYCHHIERLMVLGNFFLLTELDKDQVFTWFMEMFIDAYEWVMSANVYGMSQYSYPEMMTKPYISSSNYILKMSHYQKGEWSDIWDGLYWSFIDKNREKFADNPRMSLMLSILDRMDINKLKKHIETAERYLAKL